VSILTPPLSQTVSKGINYKTFLYQNSQNTPKLILHGKEEAVFFKKGIFD